MSSSHQWCLIHDCHQDDPAHEYNERVCEGHHRDSTWWEELRVRLAMLRAVIGGAR